MLKTVQQGRLAAVARYFAPVCADVLLVVCTLCLFPPTMGRAIPTVPAVGSHSRSLPNGRIRVVLEGGAHPVVVAHQGHRRLWSARSDSAFLILYPAGFVLYDTFSRSLDSNTFVLRTLRGKILW